jgi:hypothetical protein
MDNKTIIDSRNILIATFKIVYSEKKGCDVGVPETVDRYLVEYGEINGETDREKLVLDYLLNTNIEDHNGCCSLEGELKRYWARKTGISPVDIKRKDLDFNLLVDYLYITNDLKSLSLLGPLNVELAKIRDHAKPFYARR